MTSETIFWLMVILAFVLAFVIGANDAANALGTSYGSNATKLIYLLVLGAIFEFVGSVFLSSKLAGTLVYKVIPVMSQQPLATEERMMFSTTLSSFIFILVSSLLGMPISTTHSDVGALVGAGLAGVGPSNLNWEKVAATAASWVLSPIVSGTLSGSLFTIVCVMTLSKFSPQMRVLNLTLISGFSFALSSFMVMGLIARNVPFSKVYMGVLGYFLLGLFGSRAFMLYFFVKKT